MRHLKQSGAPAWRPSAVSVFLLRNLENSMQSYPNRFFGRDLGGGNFWVPNYLDFVVSNTQASADVTFKRRNPLCDSLPSVLCPPCALPRRLLWRLAAGSAIIHFPFLPLFTNQPSICISLCEIYTNRSSHFCSPFEGNCAPYGHLNFSAEVKKSMWNHFECNLICS